MLNLGNTLITYSLDTKHILLKIYIDLIIDSITLELMRTLVLSII